MIDVCEFCGEKKEVGESTPFHGNYCMECMKMNIENDKESIKKMRPARTKKTSTEDLKRLEQEKDAALAALMNFGN